MAQQTSVSSLLDMTSSSNVVFLGEAGSGKSEIALNFAQALAELGGKPVHFFDLDMTKPLFRSRDRREALEALGVEVHYEAQFMDAPTLTGGVRQRLNDPHCCAVLDVGGDYIGARSIGGYAPLLNRDGTTVYYVINPFRPWSGSREDIEVTMRRVLGAARLGSFRLVANPNLGPETRAEDVLEGLRRFQGLFPGEEALFACALLASLLLTWAARGASTAHAAAPQSASMAAASAHVFFLPCRCRFLPAIGPRPPFCFSACGAAHCAHSTVFYSIPYILLQVQRPWKQKQP